MFVISKRKINRFYLSLFPIIVICAIIFYSSSLTYEQQSLIPKLQVLLIDEPFHNFLTQFEIKYAGNIVSVETKGYAGFIEFLLRKSAHFFIFFLLGLLTMRALCRFTHQMWLSILLSLLFIIIYAALDEFHQHLTGGRTPLLQDVILDFVGGATAVFMLACWYKIRKKTNKHAFTPFMK